MSFLLHSFGSAAEKITAVKGNSLLRSTANSSFSLKYFAHAFLYPNHSEKNDRLLS